ncbi:S-adenosyl-L-methionine-dependent methyltransferase [Amylocarpus encephaloides]|uniref:S-adenosyl-L-methionine-dependent methyltransferase n=1 Tax=Amylocarpus encephaloides TaxID=45428 RepID=A0A9P7YBH3_9HELO|nr:S-adenosyl-L-methionine-dependent methyltransferase [Amylocarpus encephaloides]
MARPQTQKSASSRAQKGDIKDPLLTQKNFEKELQALASKAKEETTSKWALQQGQILLNSATLLSLAAVYSNVSLLALSPIYGGIPSAVYHAKGVMTACFLGWSFNLFLRRRLPVKPILLLPVLAAWIPVMQFFLGKASGKLGNAAAGAIVMESLSLLPLVFLSVGCTATVLDELEMSPGRLQWLADATPGIASFAFFKGVEFVSMGYIGRTLGSTILHTRIGLSLLLTACYSLLSPSKLLLYALPALLHTVVFNTHLPTPYGTARLNSSLMAMEGGWRLIDRQESLTGYISVVESQKQGFRVMRCDHSLLGGEWMARENGIQEPIYGVFVMLEAVRLIESEVPKGGEKALVIGLGIGTTPSAFIRLGLDTTIVEIDPVVHDYATKYFALPSRHTPILDDAVAFASKAASEGKKYQYIVHDVFTGGAEPVDLFTLEFIQDLYDLLEDGGAIAINYAADLLLPPSRITTTTILTIFPTCRIFRESDRPPPSTIATDGRDFTNMVIFCTKSPGTTISFREPEEHEYLNSRARRMFLVPKHEVFLEDFARRREGDMEVLRRNETGGFEGWQRESAGGHWVVMRTVLPEGIWESW